jgi:hypothetical protein
MNEIKALIESYQAEAALAERQAEQWRNLVIMLMDHFSTSGEVLFSSEEQAHVERKGHGLTVEAAPNNGVLLTLTEPA